MQNAPTAKLQGTTLNIWVFRRRVVYTCSSFPLHIDYRVIYVRFRMMMDNLVIHRVMSCWALIRVLVQKMPFDLLVNRVGKKHICGSRGSTLLSQSPNIEWAESMWKKRRTIPSYPQLLNNVTVFGFWAVLLKLINSGTKVSYRECDFSLIYIVKKLVNFMSAEVNKSTISCIDIKITVTSELPFPRHKFADQLKKKITTID